MQPLTLIPIKSIGVETCDAWVMCVDGCGMRRVIRAVYPPAFVDDGARIRTWRMTHPCDGAPILTLRAAELLGILVSQMSGLEMGSLTVDGGAAEIIARLMVEVVERARAMGAAARRGGRGA